MQCSIGSVLWQGCMTAPCQSIGACKHGHMSAYCSKARASSALPLASARSALAEVTRARSGVPWNSLPASSSTCNVLTAQRDITVSAQQEVLYRRMHHHISMSVLWWWAWSLGTGTYGLVCMQLHSQTVTILMSPVPGQVSLQLAAHVNGASHT